MVTVVIFEGGLVTVVTVQVRCSTSSGEEERKATLQHSIAHF